MEEREGTILSVSADKQSGRLKDDYDGIEGDFKNPALLDIKVGDGVIYLVIITPKGTIRVIKDVKI